MRPKADPGRDEALREIAERHELTIEQLLPPRWTRLRAHRVQHEFVTWPGRFRIAHAGRRSGKTECATRWALDRAIHPYTRAFPLYFVFAAPTVDQAKRIWWQGRMRLKSFLRPEWIVKSSDSDLSIDLDNGCRLRVTGMDKPERVEGDPIDGIVLDEFGNMKETAWTEHIRPGLDTDGRRPGWATFLGVPEGRNHYWRLTQKAKEIHNSGPVPWVSSWRVFHWRSDTVISKAAIDAARAELDPLVFEQEYGGEFVSRGGRVYYTFGDHSIVKGLRKAYDPAKPLALCFDFNVEPGVAVACQTLRKADVPALANRPDVADEFLAAIGEVWIPRNSNTQVVCRKVAADWRGHQGQVLLYGDATGGARTTAAVMGSDWDLIRAELGPVFGNRLRVRVPAANPAERVRVNSVNARCKTADGTIRLLVDGASCPRLVEDFEGTMVLQGSDGQIDKKTDKQRSHMTDAIGYHVVYEWPIAGHTTFFNRSA